IQELLGKIDQGGPFEAGLRALIYIRLPENAADERGMEMIQRIRAEKGAQMTLDEFKQAMREQYLMFMLDEQRAMEAIPGMLEGHKAEAAEMMKYVREIVAAVGSSNEEVQKRLNEVELLFGQKKTGKGKN
ncbi:MAG TPA: 3-hydroxyalkanoate synthetase, partial [Thermodesulfobacteriota bacterium]|nr:3-hydroxyalkanoate synthetase [Thermodesulfobacteriota bacterium]